MPGRYRRGVLVPSLFTTSESSATLGVSARTSFDQVEQPIALGGRDRELPGHLHPGVGDGVPARGIGVGGTVGAGARLPSR